MTSPSDVFLSDQFTLEGRSVVVFLTPTLLFWEWKSQLADGYREVGDSLYRQDHQSIALTDVVGANPVEVGCGSSVDAGHDPSCNCTEMTQLTDFTAAVDSNADLSVHYVKRASGHRWKVRQIIFRQPANSDEAGVAARWVASIRDRLAEPHFNRPRRLLVFINPLSGNRAAESTYSRRVSPLFDLAGVSARVIVTERAGQARDTLLHDDLTPYSGVVCVGGDGMFSELVHGLLLRTRRDEGLEEHGPDSPEVPPHLRIGVIPAGSTDTVVFSTAGCNDAVTAALHILVGDSLGLDVISVHSAEDGRFLRYNLSMLGYGFFGDIIADSEPLRWMGPARYDWLGFKKFCRLRLYRGEVAFRTGGGDEGPREAGACLSGCSVCCAPETPGEAAEGEWRTVRGEFVAVNSFLMSCRCRKAMDGAAPGAHLGNGCADLMLVRNCSRLAYMKHLLRVSHRAADQFDFDFIQVHRVREFRFSPLPDADADDEPAEERRAGPPKAKQQLHAGRVSCWNCDGEVLGHAAIRYRVHRQLVRVFGRGVEEQEDERRCGGGLCVSRYCLGCRRAKRM